MAQIQWKRKTTSSSCKAEIYTFNNVLLLLVVKSVSITTNLLLQMDQLTVTETLLQLADVDCVELNNVFES